MIEFLDAGGLKTLWDKIKHFVPSISKKALSIPVGTVDDTSTSTTFTASVPDIDKLENGVCCYITNGVVDSATGWTLNVNGLGAKPVYISMATATAATTQFGLKYTMLFIYNSTRVANGCWDMFYGYYSDADKTGLLIRTGYSTLPAQFKTYRYRLLFSSPDNTHWVGANASTSTNATAIRTPTTEKINPFGPIVYYGSTSAIAAEATFGASVLWQQYSVVLGYSFNNTGSALVLEYPKPVYVKCAPQIDGTAIIDANDPYVQKLPTTPDGNIYIYLGIAYDETHIELRLEHPVYHYYNGAIRPYTGV